MTWIYLSLYLIYLALTGGIVARRFFGWDAWQSAFMGLALSQLLIIVVGTPVYFLSSLSPTLCYALASLPTIAALLSWRCHTTTLIEEKTSTWDFKLISLSATFLLSTIYLLYILASSSTTTSILSPWLVLPKYFFIISFISSISLLAILLSRPRKIIVLVLLALYFFSTLVVNQLVYSLGSGFDPFLHQATENLIIKNGVATPKQPYYLGHYVSVVVTSEITGVDVKVVDRWLVPAIAVSLLPTLFLQAGGGLMGGAIATLLFWLTPHSALASPTPWGLASILFLASILATVVASRKSDLRSWLLVIALDIATLLVHPLAGIPAFISTVLGFILLRYEPTRSKIKIALATTTVVLSALLLPLAFWLQNRFNSSLELHWRWDNLATMASGWLWSFWPNLAGRFNWWLDLVYLWQHLWPIVVLISLVWLFFSNKKNKAHRTLLLLGATIVITLYLDALVLSCCQFGALINYEQLDYATRLTDLAKLISSLWLAVAVTLYLEPLLKQRRVMFTSIALITISGLLVSSFYLTYPRNDAYNSYHGWSVSQDDIQTVRWINNFADKQDYIVLANQVVSAAAVSEFGFAHYYNLNFPNKTVSQLYYPLPTSSPLHELTNQMLARPSQEIIDEVKKVSGVKTVCFVIPVYEKNSGLVRRQTAELTKITTSFGADVTYCWR